MYQEEITDLTAQSAFGSLEGPRCRDDACNPSKVLVQWLFHPARNFERRVEVRCLVEGSIHLGGEGGRLGAMP